MKDPLACPAAAGAFLPGRLLALPSWVIPGSLARNCRFLAGRADEVGLLFLEAASSLEYGAEDIPRDLGLLPLRFHVHLPLDLPWERPDKAARICCALWEKISFLHPCRAVLHPPAQGRAALKALSVFLDKAAQGGAPPGVFLLENTRENDLCALAGLIRDYDLRFCLDMGHILAYGQEKLLDDHALLERAELLHLSAPGPDGDAHLPLTALDARGITLARRLIRGAPGRSVLMPEMFQWSRVRASLPLIRRWLESSAP
ncbi:MAG: hypothetical protein LBJ82_05720 [Deltaproteobacteria bacterium]|nr:hypothetical protein [Deltaproteobacteria bacterium]